MRFAIRQARLADAEAIARTHTLSWQSSYRGILPDAILDGIDVQQRVIRRRAILQDPTVLSLVAYDISQQQIVGFCDAGRSRAVGHPVAEIYAIYLEHRAKRYGLGRELFERTTAWLRAQQLSSLIIWVLENNHHARRFYEAMGGRAAQCAPSVIDGFAVVKRAYVWDLI
jgi:GNAT superfamily N-acetyltransferase